VLDDVQNWQSAVSGPRIGELNAISLFFLWPPIVMGRPLYFCPVISIILSSFKPALCNRAGHIYFHPVVSSFFPSANLRGRRLDVCRASTHGVALV